MWIRTKDGLKSNKGYQTLIGLREHVNLTEVINGITLYLGVDFSFILLRFLPLAAGRLRGDAPRFFVGAVSSLCGGHAVCTHVVCTTWCVLVAGAFV
jgi:hypothetical protein